MIWKEIRCDHQNPAENCLSHTNDGPKGFETDREINTQARKEGWIAKNGMDLCPNCKARPL